MCSTSQRLFMFLTCTVHMPNKCLLPLNKSLLIEMLSRELPAHSVITNSALIHRHPPLSTDFADIRTVSHALLKCHSNTHTPQDFAAHWLRTANLLSSCQYQHTFSVPSWFYKRNVLASSASKPLVPEGMDGLRCWSQRKSVQ